MTASSAISGAWSRSVYRVEPDARWDIAVRLVMAECVEKVGAIRDFAMIVHRRRSLSNIDSFASSELNHCFKKSGRGDFFDTLGYKEASRRPKSKSALPPTSDILRLTLDFRC